MQSCISLPRVDSGDTHRFDLIARIKQTSSVRYSKGTYANALVASFPARAGPRSLFFLFFFDALSPQHPLRLVASSKYTVLILEGWQK